MFVHYHATPIGRLEITANDIAILRIDFPDASFRPGANAPESAQVPLIIQQCVKELDEYFNGKRQIFEVACQLEGTDFQKTAWQALMSVPYGQTISYGEQAKRLGNPKAVRAIGTCNGANPIAIIYPCHRIIGSNGKLTGYAGDLWVKEWLLKHEAQYSSKSSGAQGSLF